MAKKTDTEKWVAEKAFVAVMETATQQNTSSLVCIQGERRFGHFGFTKAGEEQVLMETEAARKTADKTKEAGGTTKSSERSDAREIGLTR